jgi:hypothetical protein
MGAGAEDDVLLAEARLGDGGRLLGPRTLAGLEDLQRDRARCASVNWMRAAPRPGATLSVVSAGLSPANGAPPFPIRSPLSS